MTTTYRITLIVLIVSMLAACSSPKPRVGELPQTQDEAQAIGDVGERLDTRADNLNKATTETREKLDERAADVEPQLQVIDNEAEGLRSDSDELRDIKGQLLDEQKRVDSLAGNYAKLNAENTELKSKANRLLKERMAWIGVVSVFGIGVSVMLIFFTRSSIATMVALGFVVTLGVSVAVSLYMQLIAWIAIAAVGVVGLGMIAYTIYKKVEDNRTVDELVQTGEVAKELMTPDAREQVFGRGAIPGFADTVQSLSTKELVAQIRRR